MRKERTPKTPRSIMRNHSPYCESSGPIVQEGFVAARVRALQGFSNQAQNVTRSRSPFTPCPRPSLEPEPALVGTDMPDTSTVKYFQTQILSKAHRNLVSAPGEPARVPDVAPSFKLQEQQSPLGPIIPTRSHSKGRCAKISDTNLCEDSTPSSRAQKNQDHVAAPSTQYGPPSEVDQIDIVTVGYSTPSEKSILSPHAIQADLVAPLATWNCLPQIEDRNNDYVHEQALKPQMSIADKLGSMLEQGWEGDDTFSRFYSDDRSAPHTTESKFQIQDTRLDSRSDSLDEIPRLKKVPSYSGVSTAETHHMTGQATPPHIAQKVPITFVNPGSQKRGKGQAKRSPAVNTPQRSNSDFGVQYLKTEFATPKGMRRARTLHSLARSLSGHSQIQPEDGFYGSAWDHRSSGQDHKSTKMPLSRECSVANSDFELTMLKNEQLDQSPAALSKNASSRHTRSNTKESIRSTSRSTSFFKKFPWYKVALVDKDKELVVHSLSREDCGNDRTSRATRAAQFESTSDQTELLRGIGKPRTLSDYGHEEDENCPEVKTTIHQGLIGQQAIDATTSYYEASSKSSLQLMTSPEELNEWQVPKHIQRAPERPQGCRTTGLGIRGERLLSYPHQAVKNGTGHAQGLTRTGSAGTQSSIPSQSKRMDASFELPRSSDLVQSSRPRGPEVKEQSRTQSYTPSYIKTMMLHANSRLVEGSSGSKTMGPEQGFTSSPRHSSQPRPEVLSLMPKRLRTAKGSLPARSDQDVPVHQEAQGGGKGIKKIQVTVTFDGAEDLVVEATLRKKDQQEHGRTMS